MYLRPEVFEFTKNMPVIAYVASGCLYPYHWHNTLEIIRVLSRSVNIVIGDEELKLSKNDFAVVNIDEPHRVLRTVEDNKLLFLQIDGDYCKALFENEFLFLYCCTACQNPREEFDAVNEYITNLINAIAENKSCVAEILESMLGCISYNFDFLRWGFGFTPFKEKLVTRLKRIAEHAENDIEVRIKLTELAEETGVSFKHLSADIKKRFGLSFQELIYYGKCMAAVKLLLCTNRRIIDISLECGFSDVKYFVKYFRRYFNCIPSKFRKIHQAGRAEAEYIKCPLSDALA